MEVVGGSIPLATTNLPTRRVVRTCGGDLQKPHSAGHVPGESHAQLPRSPSFPRSACRDGRASRLTLGVRDAARRPRRVGRQRRRRDRRTRRRTCATRCARRSSSTTTRNATSRQAELAHRLQGSRRTDQARARALRFLRRRGQQGADGRRRERLEGHVQGDAGRARHRAQVARRSAGRGQGTAARGSGARGLRPQGRRAARSRDLRGQQGGHRHEPARFGVSRREIPRDGA